jgi:hypothetical protein
MPGVGAVCEGDRQSMPLERLQGASGACERACRPATPVFVEWRVRRVALPLPEDVPA